MKDSSVCTSRGLMKIEGMVPKTSSRDRARWLACISATLLRPASISAVSWAASAAREFSLKLARLNRRMIPLQEALRQSSPCLIRRLFKTRKSLYSMAFTSTMADGGTGAATETTRRKRWRDEFSESCDSDPAFKCWSTQTNNPRNF